MENQNSQNLLSEVQINSVITLYSNGKFNEAINRIKELNETYPNVPLLFNILGACYKAIGNLEGAKQMFETATKIKPNYAEAYFNLALVNQQLSFINDATDAYLKAIEINPQYPDAHNNIGILYLNSKSFDLAIDHFEFAISLKSDFSEAYNNLGSALQEVNQYDKALASYKKAIAINSEFAQAHNNLGILFQKIGNSDSAILSYENAIDKNPNYIAAHHNLSAIKTYTNEDYQISQMKLILHSSDINKSQRSQLNFALAKSYRDLNKLDDSFQFLHEGNKLRKEDLNFSFEESEINYNSFIKEIFKEPMSPIEKVSNTINHKQPIFILGMPRSGTSLLEQIISSHTRVFGGGELYNLTEILIPILQDSLNSSKKSFHKDDLFLIGQKYIDKLNQLKCEEKFVTDKWPLNFRHIGFILGAIPNAKVIHIKRDEIATCWSIYRHYFADNANGWAYDFDDLARFYKAYQELMGFWEKLYPKKIHNISYEKLIKNQEDETRKLLKYCELDWDESCLNFHNNKRIVGTASVSQVRKKIYQGSSDEWKKYKKYLKPLLMHFGE